MSKAFGRNFANEDELSTYMKAITDFKSLENLLKEKGRILYDTEYNKLPFQEHISKGVHMDGALEKEVFEKLGIGDRIQLDMYGRMMQANELLVKATNFKAVPVLDAPTSWQYLLWKYEYDQERSRVANPEIPNVFTVRLAK